MFTALAVKFKWSNEKGNVDVNNRYFQQIADKYGKDMKIDAENIAKEQSLIMQRIGVLAKYQPNDANTIQEAFAKTGSIEIASRMLDAALILLKDNKMAMDVHGALVSYSTYQRKSYTYSKNIVNKEYEIEAMKKEEVNTGVAEEHSKTVTLILVKDERVEH
jgi:hypothetical protein